MAPQSDFAESYGSPSKCDALLWDTLQNRAINSPNSTALVSAHQQGTCFKDLRSQDIQRGALQDSATWTYARLMDSSLALADQLFDLGLRSGDVFVAFIPNSVEWAALLWACARLQVAFAPLNPAFVERPDDLQHIMNTLRPKGVVCAVRSFAEAIDAAIETYQRQPLAVRIYLQGEGHAEDDWICFSNLELQEDRRQTSKTVSPSLSGDKHRSNEPAMILMTSGTTTLPKACPHTTANLHAQSGVVSGIRQVASDRKFLVLGPLFHIQSIWNVLMAWRVGAAVVLPSPTFEADAALNTLAHFECTHMSCGPSMVSALVAHPSFSKDGYEYLQSLALGSDLISRDLVELCRERFRAQKVFAGWGMSESSGCIVLAAGKDVSWHEGTPTVGYVTPGNAVRVCKPGTRTPVKKGETGELHIGGNATIGGYFNGSHGAMNDAFYLSNDINWLATGDLALMDDSEAIFIKGRIKDMIIRGGENISPAAMESCIDAIGGVKSQVIGIRDPVFGQVPVAVLALKLKDCERADLVQSIQQQIKVRFGNTHRLRHVLTLNDLELAQYPTTATGKVKKGVLRDAVEEFLGGNKVTVSKPTGTLDAILTIWKELLAAGNSDITPQLSVTTLADSLMMLRFCFEVEQRLGKRMTIAEILKNVTPVAQARLLDSHANGTASIESSAATSKPVWEQQAQQSKEDNTLVTDRVRSAINECLQSIGACWPNDVEAVYEPHEGMDMSLSGNARSSSCNVRWAFEVTEESTTAEKIYESLAQVLERHAALRAVIVPLEKRCHPLRSIHVVLKANQKWLQHAVKVIEPVDRAENLMNIIDGGNMPFGGGLGQQALQACIVPLEGSDSGTRFGLCLSVCHAVFDAMSMTAFMKDLHSSLRQEPIPRTTPIPYMAFAEVYRIHKGSALGRRTAMYHANKFVSSKVPLSCLWPPSKGPGFFIGPDDGWKLDDGSPGQASDRVSSDATAGISRGRAVHSKAKIPGLQELKSEHSIEPSTVFKAAVALFNAEQTGGDRAVFKTTSAGRTWPFLEDWIAQSLPHALGIAGPCLTYSIDCIAIGRGQGVGELLRDVQASEEMDRSYPHAPWVSIREGLDEPVRKALDAVVRRQTFNWDPSTKARHATARPALKTLARLGFIDVGFWWNFGVVAEDEVAGFVLYDDVHLVNTQASDALARVFVLAQLLVEKDSWEKTLGQVLERRA